MTITSTKEITTTTFDRTVVHLSQEIYTGLCYIRIEERNKKHTGHHDLHTVISFVYKQDQSNIILNKLLELFPRIRFSIHPSSYQITFPITHPLKQNTETSNDNTQTSIQMILYDRPLYERPNEENKSIIGHIISQRKQP